MPPQEAAAVMPINPAAGAETGNIVSRIIWLVLFAAPTAVFATAASLTPNPVGHGTHMQLGLPPCGFYVMTGYPCPGCGLTTCFSYMVRGDVVNAALANPFGVMLFLISAAVAIVAFIGLIKAWPVVQTLDRFHAEKWAILLAVSSLTVWGVKIATLMYS